MTSPTTDRRLGLVGNIAMKTPVTVLAASNITQSGEQTIDGIAVLAVNASSVPDRVLCAGMTDATKNGIWDVSTAAWTRSKDANGNYDLGQGSTVLVNLGTAYAGSYWKISTTGPITIGTTSMTWARALANSASTVSYTPAGALSVTRTVETKLQDIVSRADYSTDVGFFTAVAALANRIGVKQLDIGSGNLFGYVDNALARVYRDVSSPTGIQQSLRVVTSGNGDNATFRGVVSGYFEARDRAGVTGANKGVLYAVSLSVVPGVARNNVPYDDVDGLTISNTTGVVAAKATDAIYISNNTTAFGDRLTGTSEWYSLFTADCNADVGIALNGKIASIGIDLNGANFPTGAAMRLPNAASIYARNAANAADLQVIRLDTNNTVRLGGANVSGTLIDNWFGTTAPVTSGAATYSVGLNDNNLIFTAACTVTLPAVASFTGRIIRLKTTGFAIASASANVVPLVGGGAGTPILAAVAGRWALLASDGAAWQIMAAN